MASKSSDPKPRIIFFLFFLSLALLLLTASFRLNPLRNELRRLQYELSEGTIHSLIQNPKWYDIIVQKAMERKIKIGLVNMDEIEEEDYKLQGLADTMMVKFDRVAEDRRWEDYFPEWIDEDETWAKPSCPEIPIPRFEDYGEVDIVVARVPCGSGEENNKGIRDVFRLQVNLVVANLVLSGWMKHDVDRTVFVVFIGSCGPMLEIFRCDDLLSHEGDYWVYKPDLRRLKQKVLMPVGSCQLAAAPHAEPDYNEDGSTLISRSMLSKPNNSINQPREAYVTILHSSESYVCGAIALAQSIIQTNTTKDLVLLADDSITKKSLQGLKAAGWKIKHIKRIRNPNAERNTYNEWNYSKLRLWQLTDYDKVIFIDADLLVLKNIDHFFLFPQLSAVGNHKVLFNSGVILVEPSKCMFETLMKKRYTLISYNGGDQGFLNEVFTWWHRWPTRLNYLKWFKDPNDVGDDEISKDIYAMHYLGVKPWRCYRDYDCNWDRSIYQKYASDSAHRRWWKVYEAMPKKLQPYCALTETMDGELREWREMAKNASQPDGHWKIRVSDPRQHAL